MTSFPLAIRFTTDDNEAFLVREEKTNGKVLLGYYQFCVSLTKEGREYPFELEYLDKLLRNDLIKIIE